RRLRASPALIQTADSKTLAAVLGDDKTAKQVANAAKRASKKRPGAPSSDQSAPASKKPRPSAYAPPTESDPELSLQLPAPVQDEGAISATVLQTNRAPLVLAFATVVLQYTMPEQPLSSRLSLAQALVAMNSRAK